MEQKLERKWREQTRNDPREGREHPASRPSEHDHRDGDDVHDGDGPSEIDLDEEEDDEETFR